MYIRWSPLCTPALYLDRLPQYQPHSERLSGSLIGILSTSSVGTAEGGAEGGVGGGARGDPRTEATADGIAMERRCSGAGGIGGAPRAETERERERCNVTGRARTPVH